jgi:hypothetical protein
MDGDNINKEIKKLEAERLLMKHKTNLVKSDFIRTIKNGLGEEIKKNNNKITVRKKTFLEKIALIIKNIFTKF